MMFTSFQIGIIIRNVVILTIKISRILKMDSFRINRIQSIYRSLTNRKCCCNNSCQIIVRSQVIRSTDYKTISQI